MKHFGLTVMVAAMVLAGGARADVKMPAIFGDHMVLQRERKAPVWGSADPGEKVTVKAQGQEKSATADEKGKWRVELDPLNATGPIELTISGKNSITLKDVLVGEVWLCSGQSNMGFTLQRAANATEALKNADRPTVRLFKVKDEYKDHPQEDLSGTWQVCTPDDAKGFSAVAYFFGTELQKKVDAPIGLIQSSWGGTRAEAWIPRATFDALKLPYEPQWTEQWLHPKKANSESNSTSRERPYEAPSVIYNAKIAPIVGFAMRGAVWYQGETNTAHPAEYRQVLSALIKSWRDVWQEGDFPFLVVQLPNFKTSTRDWVTLRQSQAQVAKDLPNVGMVVTIDIGDPHNIHPTEKLTVGKRLAAVAEKMAYEMNVPDQGPTFKSLNIQGNRAIVTFSHDEGGLEAKGELKGFQIAGADGKFVDAEAKIEGDKVVLTAKDVSEPVAVRYGWENDPTCTLYNRAGFPAEPFDQKMKG